jgi:FKBP-type peptidyl-prolyl cis-trans isomerase SlyD
MELVVSKLEKPNRVTDNVIVTMDYSLTVNGEVVDTTEGDEPLEFLQGHQNIIPGLEKELYGLGIGEDKEVTVESEDAYGDFDPKQIVNVPRSEFPEDFPIREGVELETKDTRGNARNAIIIEVGEEEVKLDFNHPLAGKELRFVIKIADLRKPTEEELDHGHVH